MWSRYEVCGKWLGWVGGVTGADGSLVMLYWCTVSMVIFNICITYWYSPLRLMAIIVHNYFSFFCIQFLIFVTKSCNVYTKFKASFLHSVFNWLAYNTDVFSGCVVSFSPQTWKILFIFVTPACCIKYPQFCVCVRDIHLNHNCCILMMSVLMAEMFFCDKL